MGPDTKSGFVSNLPRTICDVTPTIGELLGFTTESATGSVMHELFVPEEAPAPVEATSGSE